VSLRLRCRAALDADGRVRSPVCWSIEGGRTLALERDPSPGAATGTDTEAWNTLLVPGLVNAHAHLDLAGSEAVPAGQDFPEWLLGIGAARQSAEGVREAAGAQAAALGAAGVCAIGDIDGTTGEGTRGRRDAGVAGRSYLEIVGVNPESARRRLVESLRLVDLLGGGADELGLSPHAPYSVHMDVLPEIARAATARGLPLAMHLAETEEETRYLTHGDGPFERFLQTIDRGRPFDRPPGLRPVALAEAAGLLAAGCVVIHGNDLSDDDIELLAGRPAPVVYCHGTHRHFERPAHRLLDLIAAGVTVAFGTDSGASNQGVDVFAELCRLAADRPDVPPLAILEGATAGGRAALRLPRGPEIFAAGSSADGLLVGPLPEGLETGPPEALAEWMFSGQARPLCTIHGGRLQEPVQMPPDGRAGFLDSLPGHG